LSGWVVFAVCAIFILPAPELFANIPKHAVESPHPGKAERKLNRVRRELEGLKTELSENKRKRVELQQSLIQLQKEIEEQEEVRSELEGSLFKNQAEISTTKEEILALSNLILSQKKELRIGLTLLMEQSEIESSPLLNLYEKNESSKDGSIRTLLERKAQEQSQKMALLEANLISRVELERKLERDTGKAQALREEIATREQVIREQLDVQEKVFKKLQTRSHLALSRLTQLRKDQRLMQSVLNKQLAQFRGGDRDSIPTSFLNRGALEFPLKGQIVNRFGRSKDRELGISIMNKGIKITPFSRGTQAVHASANGRVVFSGFLESYGKLVIVEYATPVAEETYFYLVGGLKSLKVNEGDWVTKGQLLGETNQTIYFELRNGRKAVNPLPHFG